MKLNHGYTTFSSCLQLKRQFLLYKPNIIEIKVNVQISGKMAALLKMVGQNKFSSSPFNLEYHVSSRNQNSLESQQLLKMAANWQPF